MYQIIHIIMLKKDISQTLVRRYGNLTILGNRKRSYSKEIIKK